MPSPRWAAALALPLALGGCALSRPPAGVDAPAPSRWLSPLPAKASAATPAAGSASAPGARPPAGAAAALPHAGQVAELAAWWRQWDDPLLSSLIEAAQQASPTLAAARSRVVQARAAQASAGAQTTPQVDATASATRGRTDPSLPTRSVGQAGLQAAWEIDLFGAGRAARDAARARTDAAGAGWHAARVSVAAETASAYLGLRACERQRAVAEKDAASRAETARLVQLSADAGFTAPATAALARASAAEGSARLRQQRALCESQLQALSALTAVDAGALRQRLAAQPDPALADPGGISAGLARTLAESLEDKPLFTVAAVPAQALAQRPDVFEAEQAVAAAAAEVGGARADRFPRLSLAGSVAAGRVRTAGVDTNAQTWSFGPLALTLPVFDAGRRAASVEAAQARYDEAVSQYRARVRQAAREVEEALIALDSARGRSGDARVAAEGYRASFVATETRHRNGLASLVELEDARRNLLAAETALVGLQRELQDAWIGLYRAAGGGWQRGDAVPATTPNATPASASASASAPASAPARRP